MKIPIHPSAAYLVVVETGRSDQLLIFRDIEDAKLYVRSNGHRDKFQIWRYHCEDHVLIFDEQIGEDYV